MKVLVTGADGFVGRYVIEELEGQGHQVIPCGLNHEGMQQADLRDPEAVQKLVQTTQPEACIHLAGIAFVPKTWEDPSLAFSVNTLGTLYLLEALRKENPETRVLVISSSEVYGREVRHEPIRECDDLRPDNPYGLSKMAADKMTLLFAERHGLPAMTARPINHIGPGQSSNFVIASFAKQLVQIAEGTSEPVMRVGNLESRRDFLDVRDVARAYRLLLEKGTGGEAYNIASGNLVSIQTALDELCRITQTQPAVEVDQALYRPTDEQPRLNTEKIRQATGWTPGYALTDTLQDVVDALKT